VLYVYAITEAGVHPDAAGLHGTPVDTIPAGPIAAVASEHSELRLEPAEEELWAHESVVEAVMADAPVLPMRIGSVVADRAAVVALLRQRAAEFGAALDHVRGAVEIGVRAAVDASRIQPRTLVESGGGPGTTYMLSRLDRKLQNEELGSRIHVALCSLARDHTPLASSHERMTLSASYLVADERVEDFTDRVGRLEEETAGVTLVCTGPWPPYSFTTGETP
jgi:Gas vesicle synthesis protein GvpL/GvpF